MMCLCAAMSRQKGVPSYSFDGCHLSRLPFRVLACAYAGVSLLFCLSVVCLSVCRLSVGRSVGLSAPDLQAMREKRKSKKVARLASIGEHGPAFIPAQKLI